MDKDSYNIDSILSEVKKRREENEKRLREADKKENSVQPAPEEKAQVKAAETPAPKPKKTAAPEPKETAVQKPKQEAPVQKETRQEEKVLKVVDETPEQEVSEVTDDKNEVLNVPEEKESENKDYVDILHLQEETAVDFEKDEYSEIPPKGKKPKMDKKKKKKIIISVVSVLLVLIVAAGVVVYVWANNALNQVVDKESKATTESEWAGMDELVENFDPIQETEATELSSLQDMIKTWYYNGTPASSTHVINIMLIGEDTRGSEILDDGTRADAAIIASVNIDTKQITLTSILRDTYTYWETEEGNESTGQFGKINGAMSTGDINAYINCVERMYKIAIDNYVIVNFDSFEEIVDALGGVTLELTNAEIREINNHPKRYGNVVIDKTFEGNKGEMKLTGKQALAYCRIRKLDSDNMRADRQKTCLVEIFNEARNGSKTKLLKLVNALIPYVNTNCSKKQIVQIAKYAFSQGWLDFDIQMTTVPESRINEKGAGGIFYGAWCWKSDFPQDAYNLQTKLYGKSSITLARTRVDVLKCAEKGFRSEGAYAVSATITNNNYGEVTTLPSTTEKEEE